MLFQHLRGKYFVNICLESDILLVNFNLSISFYGPNMKIADSCVTFFRKLELSFSHY